MPIVFLFEFVCDIIGIRHNYLNRKKKMSKIKKRIKRRRDCLYEKPTVVFLYSPVSIVFFSVLLLGTTGIMYGYVVGTVAYFVIYFWSMRNRCTWDDKKNYKDLITINEKFTSLCFMPGTFLITAIGFYLTAYGSPLSGMDVIHIMSYINKAYEYLYNTLGFLEAPDNTQELLAWSIIFLPILYLLGLFTMWLSNGYIKSLSFKDEYHRKDLQLEHSLPKILRKKI